MHTLVIRAGARERRVSFESGSVTIGRGEGCEIQLDDPRCSRRHLTFTAKGDVLTVRDLGSRNGSMLNGRRLVEPATLRDGDVVRVGGTEILVERPAPGGRSPRSSADDTIVGEDDAIDTGPVVDEDDVSGDPVSRLLELNHRLAGADDLSGLLDEIVASALELTGASRGFLLEREGERLSFAVARTAGGGEIPSPASEISRSVVGDALRKGDAVISGNARDDIRFEDAVSVANLSLVSVLCVPLRRGARIIGVLYVDTAQENAFDDSHRRLLGHFADQASIALERATLLAELTARTQALARSNAEVARLCSDLEEKVRIQTEELTAAREELAHSRARDRLRYSYDEIEFESPLMREVLSVLDRVTDSDVPVLLEGESGTGKELLARALHHNSPRAERPFQAINCAAVSESLLESELFGVERGAFTGADRDRKGLIELAQGGTLFLDEVGEMSLAMQAKLLRVLEDREVRPVGGKATRHVDLRLVAATNRKLAELVESGAFRSDLYYRIRGVAIELPPLRARREDIPLLIDRFIERHGAPGTRKSFTRSLIDLLMAYDWPGNVRELEQEVRRLLALGDEVIGPEHASPHIRVARATHAEAGTPLAGPLRDQVDDLERRAIAAALERHGGNKSRVADELGLSRPGLAKKMRRLGLGE